MQLTIFIYCLLTFAVSLHLQEKHELTVDDFPLGKVNIQSGTGNYLARCSICGTVDTATVNETNADSPTAIWTVEWVGKYVAFKADNGKYLTRCRNCWAPKTALYQDAVFVNATSSADVNAQWKPEDLGSGFWGLRSWTTYKCLIKCLFCVNAFSIYNYAFVQPLSPKADIRAKWRVKVR